MATTRKQIKRRNRSKKEQPKETVDFPDLDHWKVVGRPTIVHSVYVVKAEVDLEPSCRKCRSPGYELVRNGRGKDDEPQIITDEPRGSKPVAITIRRQAFLCNNHDKPVSVLQPLPGVYERRRITDRLREYIIQSVTERSYEAVAKAVGLKSEKISDIFKDYIEEKGRATPFRTPEWLGIDEVYIRGEKDPWCVLTDIQNRTLYDLLPVNSLEAVAEFLERLPEPHRVEAVAML